MKNFTKILSVLCALALLVSAISTGFVANAATGVNNDEYSVGDDGTYTSVYGINHLSSASLTATVTDPTADPALSNEPMSHATWAGAPATLTDGNSNVDVVYQAGKWVTNYAGNDKGKYHQYDFTLGAGVNNPETFLVAQKIGSGEVPCKHYEVFMAKTAAELETASPVITWNSTSTAEQVFDISGENLTGIKYVRVRFYHLGNGCVTKMKEIALYGGVSELTINSSLTSDSDGSYESVYGKNNLTGSTITYNIVETTNPTINGSHYPTANIIDGSSETLNQIQISSAVGSASDYTQKSEYMDIMFELSAPINNPQKFLIAYRNGTGESSMHYAIYASSSKDTLFSNEVYEYSSASNNGQENIIDLSSKKLTNIKFFAIRFYNLPVYGSCVLPREIALFGGKSILEDNSTYTVDEDNTYAAFGTNMLANSTVATTAIKDGAAASMKESNVANLTYIADGTVLSRNQIQIANVWDNYYNFSKANTNTYIQVTFTLADAINNPKKFLIAHDDYINLINPTVNQWYEIFASDSESDLYSKSLFTYKNSSQKNVEQIIDLSGMELKDIKYFGIRFYHLPTGCFALPSEIALYGGKVACMNTNDYATIYSHSTSFENGNWLAGGTYSSAGYFKGNAVTLNSTGDQILLTDDRAYERTMIQSHDINEPTNLSLDTVDTTTYYDVTFELAASIDNPDSFIMAHDMFQSTDSGSPYVSQWYDIYAADTLANLNSAEPVYTYKNSSKYAVQLVDISNKQLKNVKFFRVRFYHMPLYGNCIIPSEIGLYGGKLTPAAVWTYSDSFTSDANNSYATVYGDNVLAYGSLSAMAVNNGSTVKTFNPSGLTDGSSYTMNMMQASDSSGTLFPSNPTIEDNIEQKDAYIELTWNFAEAISFLEKVLISHTANSATPVNTNFTSKHYAIYASTSTSDLYSDENLVVEYAREYRTGIEHFFDISSFELKDIKAFGIRFYEMEWGNCIIPSEIGLYCGVDPDAINIELAASVYTSTAPGSGDTNDIQYRLDLSTAEDADIVEAGLISGFKVNIDADTAFAGDYAEYLKTTANGSVISKTTIPEELHSSSEVYFHHTNSGTHNGVDYSAYRICTIGYVIVEDANGRQTTYWTNVIDKSSMMISRNQAKAFKEAGYVIEGYESYAFDTDGTLDIAVVRGYVEAVSEILQRTYTVSMDNELMNVQGRAYQLKNGIATDFAAGGVEFKADCQGTVTVKVKVRLTSISGDNDPPKFAFTVDGGMDRYYECQNVVGVKEYDIVIAEGLTRDVHEFGIYKYNGFSADIVSITVGGKLVENDYAERPEIHFYGDSITHGHYSVITVNDGVNPVLYDWTGVYDPINNPDAILRVMIAIKDGSGNVVYENRMAYYNPNDSTNHIFYLEDGTQVTYAKSSYSAYHRFYGYDTATGEADRLMREVVYGTGVHYTTTGRENYASLLARNMNANYDIYAISGSNYQGMTANYYVDTRNGGTYTPTPADVVVVSHAQNSMYKEGNDYAGYMKQTVENIRKVSPDAAIIFTYGFHVYDGLGTYKNAPTGEMYSASEHNAGIVKTVNEIRQTDDNVYAFKMSVARDGGVLNHPSIANMHTMAAELESFITENNLIK